jgi:hypothetical protein
MRLPPVGEELTASAQWGLPIVAVLLAANAERCDTLVDAGKEHQESWF